MDILIDGLKVGEIDSANNVFKESETFEHYFIKTIGLNPDQFNDLLDKVPTTCSILKFIIINEEYQRKGFAKKEVEKLIAQSKDGVILVCEMVDPWLIDWYERLGFETIGHYKHLPIMIKRR